MSEIHYTKKEMQEMIKRFNSLSVENLVLEKSRKGNRRILLITERLNTATSDALKACLQESQNHMEFEYATRSNDARSILEKLLSGTSLKFHNIAGKKYGASEELRRGYILLQPEKRTIDLDLIPEQDPENYALILSGPKAGEIVQCNPEVECFLDSLKPAIPEEKLKLYILSDR